MGELWSTNQKVIDAHVEPPNSTFFRETIIRPLGGAGPSNLYTTYNSLKCISHRTRGAGRPHVGLCPIFLVSYKTDEIVLGERNLQFPGVGEGGLVISSVTSTFEVFLNDMHCITSCFTLLTLVGAVFTALLLTKI